MVAHLVRLKLRLLAGGLRRDPWRLVATVLGVLWTLAMVGVAVAALVALRFADLETARTAVTVGGALAVVAWTVVPLVAFGVDETLDPARFATFTISRRDLVVGLALAGVVGVPGIATVAAVLATVVTWSRGPLAVLVALACVPVAVLTCVVSARLATTLAADLVSRPRSREAGAAVVAVTALSLGPAIGLLTRDSPDLAPLARAAADLLSWTPLGWVWAAPAAVAGGEVGGGLVRLVLATAWLAGAMLLWGLALDRALVAPRGSGGTRRAGGSWVDRLPGTPLGAVTGRSLRYWRRDPRYVTSMVATVALPLALAGLVIVDVVSVPTAALAVGPLVGGTLGWGLHNDVAYDGTAVWTHLSAGVPGRVDRLGRALAALTWGVPVTVAFTLAGVAAADRWELLPGALGLSLGLLGAGAGVSAVTSAALPYQVPEPGANPFASPPGAGVTAVLAQLLAGSATGLLALPTSLAFLLAVRGSGAASWAGLVLGLATGVAALLVGARVGGGVLDRRGPELLLALRR